MRIEQVADRAGLERWLTVRAEVVPEDVLSVARLEHLRASQAQRVDLVAWLGRDLAGAAFLAGDASARESAFPFAAIMTRPGRRNRGVGSLLHLHISARARAVAKEGLTGEVREDDDATLRYLRRRQYAVVDRRASFALELTPGGAAPKQAGGEVEIVSLAERRQLQPGMYAVACDAVPDIPAVEAVDPGDYESWRAAEVDDPATLTELSLVAVAGSEVVGYATLAHGAEPEVGVHRMTAVRRTHRRRGIARLLKQEQIRRAASRGYTRLLTYVDDKNQPMRALNQSLGYRELPAWLLVRGPLIGEGKPPDSSRRSLAPPESAAGE